MSGDVASGKTAGQIASKPCLAPCGGKILLLDRNKGADWLDADYRWVVMHVPSSLHISLPTRRDAKIYMDDAVAGTAEEILPAPGEEGSITPR